MKLLLWSVPIMRIPTIPYTHWGNLFFAFILTSKRSRSFGAKCLSVLCKIFFFHWYRWRLLEVWGAQHDTLGSSEQSISLLYYLSLTSHYWQWEKIKQIDCLILLQPVYATISLNTLLLLALTCERDFCEIMWDIFSDANECIINTQLVQRHIIKHITRMLLLRVVT